MKNLTKRQEEILNLIKNYIFEFGFPPTRADIAKSLGFKSPNAAEQHLRAIEKKGFIIGVKMAVARILRCNPWGGSGIDMVCEEDAKNKK